MKYPREIEAREIILKTHTDTGCHLIINKIIQKNSINRIKWQMMWDRCSIVVNFE